MRRGLCGVGPPGDPLSLPSCPTLCHPGQLTHMPTTTDTGKGTERETGIATGTGTVTATGTTIAPIIHGTPPDRRARTGVQDAGYTTRTTLATGTGTGTGGGTTTGAVRRPVGTPETDAAHPATATAITLDDTHEHVLPRAPVPARLHSHPVADGIVVAVRHHAVMLDLARGRGRGREHVHPLQTGARTAHTDRQTRPC